MQLSALLTVPLPTASDSSLARPALLYKSLYQIKPHVVARAIQTYTDRAGRHGARTPLLKTMDHKSFLDIFFRNHLLPSPVYLYKDGHITQNRGKLQ
jgi:hypothetical protein